MSSSGDDGINFDCIGGLITRIKFVQNKKNGNLFLNFCDGIKMYSDIKNGNFSKVH